MNKLSFTKIIPSEDQIKILYDLLSKRQHAISHDQMPDFEAHKNFVSNHPYRAWYIVEAGSKPTGSFYISQDNTIGINLLDGFDESEIEEILNYIKSAYDPLPEIKSVRKDIYAVNVPPSNAGFIKALDTLGMKVLQISYTLVSE